MKSEDMTTVIWTSFEKMVSINLAIWMNIEDEAKDKLVEEGREGQLSDEEGDRLVKEAPTIPTDPRAARLAACRVEMR